ncbi:MAG: cell division topological specificity factor MinE [Anaerolineae bacterium]
MGFLDRLLGRRDATSGDVAKDRLVMVLVHDRARITPGMLDQMKDEMISVISRYIQIEPEGVQVSFTQDGRESRLVANIPVVGPSGRVASR